MADQRGPFLSTPLAGAGTLARLARRPAGVATVAPWQLAARAQAGSYLSTRAFATLLDRNATYAGSDPLRRPAARASIPYAEQAHGSGSVRGGIHQLRLAAAERPPSAALPPRPRCALRPVVVTGGRAAGVELANGEAAAADVVGRALTPPALLATCCRPDRRTRRARRGPDAATPPLRVRAAPRAARPHAGLAHHTVLFPADYDAEFDAVFGTGATRGPRPVPDPTVYVSAPDDPALRPDADSESCSCSSTRPGTSPVAGWTGTSRGSPGGTSTRAGPRHGRTRGYDSATAPAWRAHRDSGRPRTPDRSPAAPSYGMSSTAPGRRSCAGQRLPRPGLFLVGGSAHPGGGLPLVGLSAQIVAGLVGPAGRRRRSASRRGTNRWSVPLPSGTGTSAAGRRQNTDDGSWPRGGVGRLASLDERAD